MIKLFNATARTFESNGITAIHPIKLIEKKKFGLSGWEIDVELDLKHKDLIEQDMLAVVQTKSKKDPQAFRINNIEYTQRKMIFTAQHVFFDAHRYYLVDVRPTNMGAKDALNYVSGRTDKTNPFTFDSDITERFTTYFYDRSLMYALEQISTRWGGNYDADNWSVELRSKLGDNRGEMIAYGKNLQGIKIHEDWSSVVTKIYPVGFDGLRLPEVFLESKTQYNVPYTSRVDFETAFEDEAQTESNMLPELRKNAKEHIEKNQYPKVSYEVTSDINQRFEIGDTIQVKHPLVMLETEVQEYEYNVLTKRVFKLVFGNYKRNVKTKFDKIKADIEKADENISKVQILANEKNKIFGGDGEPSGKLNKGDLQYRPTEDGEFEIMQYNGSGWETIVATGVNLEIGNAINLAFEEINKVETTTINNEVFKFKLEVVEDQPRIRIEKVEEGEV